MWPLAAEASTSSSDALIVTVGTLAGGVVAGVVTIIVALINRSTKTDPSPPAAGPTPPTQDDITVRERVRVLEFRVDDHDHAEEIQDRRLDQLERALDIDNPRWRHR